MKSGEDSTRCLGPGLEVAAPHGLTFHCPDWIKEARLLLERMGNAVFLSAKEEINRMVNTQSCITACEKCILCQGVPSSQTINCVHVSTFLVTQYIFLYPSYKENKEYNQLPEFLLWLSRVRTLHSLCEDVGSILTVG